jgi:outer membrane receptor protein involved in Fe transport
MMVSRNSSVSGLRASLLAGAMLMPAMPVQAQEAASPVPQASADARGGLEEIVVTARKRNESVQSVPVAVTALSEAQIQRMDLTSIEKIAARTPSLTVGRASNGSGAQVTLRGIGSSSSSIGIEQSVATVVDGAYYGQGRVINEGFFDLGRVEILKGPQALFFGKNATAGVISITTADPTVSPEFRLRGGYEFKARQVLLEGIASGPLGDTLGARLAVRASKMFGGYFRNRAGVVNYRTTDIATGIVSSNIGQPAASDQPGEKELIGRLTLKWEPSDGLTDTFKLYGGYNRNNNPSWNYVAYNCPTGFSSKNPIYRCGRHFIVRQNDFAPTLAADFPYARDDGKLYNRYTSWAVNNSLNYELDGVTLSSVTNYNWNNNRFALQGDFQSSDRPTWATEDTTWHAFSQEVRLLTTFDAPVNLMVGGLYQKTKRDFDQPIAFIGVSDSRQPAENRFVATRKNSETRGETLSAFGQVTWKVFPQLEAAGGVRYTHETKKSVFSQVYSNAALAAIFRPANSPDGLGVIRANQTFNDWSPEATLTWKPTQDVLVYGGYKTAYKSGGFSNGGINSGFSADPLGDLTFDKEKAQGFELGIKSTLAGRQLRLNLTAFTYKYSDLQIDFFNSSIIAFQTLTADARTKGLELEAEYAPRAVPGLNLHGSLNYIRARYVSFPDAPCYAGQTPAQGCNLIFGAGGLLRPITGAEVGVRQDLSGKPLSMAPKWTGQAGISYDGDVGSNLRFGIAADIRYSSAYIPSGFGQLRSRQGAYATLDAQARIGRDDQRWELAIIGKNLTNRFFVNGVVDGPDTGTGTGTPAGVPADQIGFAALPRTVQLQLTVRY